MGLRSVIRFVIIHSMVFAVIISNSHECDDHQVLVGENSTTSSTTLSLDPPPKETKDEAVIGGNSHKNGDQNRPDEVSKLKTPVPEPSFKKPNDQITITTLSASNEEYLHNLVQLYNGTITETERKEVIDKMLTFLNHHNVIKSERDAIKSENEVYRCDKNVRSVIPYYEDRYITPRTLDAEFHQNLAKTDGYFFSKLHSFSHYPTIEVHHILMGYNLIYDGDNKIIIYRKPNERVSDYLIARKPKDVSRIEKWAWFLCTLNAIPEDTLNAIELKYWRDMLQYFVKNRFTCIHMADIVVRSIDEAHRRIHENEDQVENSSEERLDMKKLAEFKKCIGEYFEDYHSPMRTTPFKGGGGSLGPAVQPLPTTPGKGISEREEIRLRLRMRMRMSSLIPTK